MPRSEPHAAIVLTLACPDWMRPADWHAVCERLADMYTAEVHRIDAERCQEARRATGGALRRVARGEG